MRCLVTAGPTVEPLDSVRRLTNHSTGTLGTDLANHLACTGHDVLLLRSRTATAAPALHAVTTEAFATAADLLGRFEAHATQEPVAIFHAAAVGDFQIGTVFRRDSDGGLVPVHSGKHSTRDGVLLAELRPTPKILAQLRDLYPKAWITGNTKSMAPATRSCNAPAHNCRAAVPTPWLPTVRPMGSGSPG